MPILVSPSAVAVQGIGSPGESLQPITLSLGGLTLGVTDDYGVKWSVTKIKGWFTQPTTNGTAEDRASDHGSWLTPSYYPGRVVEVEGYLEAVDWVQAYQALERLTSAIPPSVPDTMYVNDGVRTLQADVRQQGDVLDDEGDGIGVVTFSLSLIAPDPRRYSDTATTLSTGLPTTTGGLSLGGTGLSLPLTVGASLASGLISATNDGNMDTPPTLTVAGPCPAFSLRHNSGRTLTSPNAVPAGRSVSIDTDKGRTLLDDGSAWLMTGSYFRYDPGVNTVAFTSATYDPAALLTSAHRSAWR